MGAGIDYEGYDYDKSAEMFARLPYFKRVPGETPDDKLVALMNYINNLYARPNFFRSKSRNGTKVDRNKLRRLQNVVSEVMTIRGIEHTTEPVRGPAYLNRMFGVSIWDTDFDAIANEVQEEFESDLADNAAKSFQDIRLLEDNLVAWILSILDGDLKKPERSRANKMVTQCLALHKVWYEAYYNAKKKTNDNTDALRSVIKLYQGNVDSPLPPDVLDKTYREVVEWLHNECSLVDVDKYLVRIKNAYSS